MHFDIPQRRPGACADIDIIVVDGDPLRSVKAPESVQLAMQDGKVLKSEIRELANWARAERRFLVPAQP